VIVAPYDGSYTPAAIVLPVIVEGVVSGRSAVMGLFVDPLAAQSVIAVSLVDGLGLTLFGEGAIIGSEGQPLSVPSYFATIWVEGRAHWLSVLGYGDTSYAGRDILDQLSITLDGSNQRLLVRLSSAEE
jgi:hypothetical protein